MVRIKQICKDLALATGAKASIDATTLLGKVDFQSLGQTSEFILWLKTVSNTVAPGASRTLTPILLWSPEDLTTAQVLAQCAGTSAAFSLDASSALPNLANGIAWHRITHIGGATGLDGSPEHGLRPLARFLYVFYTKTTEDGGSVTSVTLNLHLLRARAKKL